MTTNEAFISEWRNDIKCARNAISSTKILPDFVHVVLELYYVPPFCGSAYFAQIFEQDALIHAVYARPHVIKNQIDSQTSFSNCIGQSRDPYSCYKITCGKLLNVFDKSFFISFCEEIQQLPPETEHFELQIDGISYGFLYYDDNQLTHSYFDNTENFFFKNDRHIPPFQIIHHRILKNANLY